MDADASGNVVAQRVVDLSHGITADTPVYPGDPTVSFAPAATIPEHGFNVLHVRMGSQTGTHVDAPYHFVGDGARVDDLDLSLLFGPAVIADVRGAAARSPVTWSALEPYAARLHPGRILLLHTGWSRFWGDPAYFDHPYLDAGAARRLIDRGIRTIGIDALSVDETLLDASRPNPFAAHHVILGAGGVIAENLANLAAVDWEMPLVSMLPLRLAAADGAPVRAVAVQLTTSLGMG